MWCFTIMKNQRRCYVMKTGKNESRPYPQQFYKGGDVKPAKYPGGYYSKGEKITVGKNFPGSFYTPVHAIVDEKSK